MIECKDGVCYLVDMTNDVVAAAAPAVARITHGYQGADAIIAFLNGVDPTVSALGEWSLAALAAAFLGGIALNLTPCVLPMIPVNLLIIGKSVRSGLLYGLGIALAYGTLGLAAAFGGLAFGVIQSNPWFNLVVAAAFVALALALFGLWNAGIRAAPPAWLRALKGPVLPFAAGAVSAVLAGACVAPVLVSALMLTAREVARGNRLAVVLPFLLGLGMALPWPFVGAGLKVLPRPGAWMRWVNVGFALVVLTLAGWYGRVAYRGFTATAVVAEAAEGVLDVPVGELAARVETAPRPLLVDCWASWCKNCAALAEELKQPSVQAELKRFTVFRVQAEDLRQLQQVPGFEGVKGLPALVVFE